MATPEEDVVASKPVGTDEPSHVLRRRGRERDGMHVSLMQFEARPERPPPLKMMTIGGGGDASIALK